MNRLLIAGLLLLLLSCNTDFSYQVQAVRNDLIKVDGALTEPVWQNSQAFSRFVNPWRKEVSPETSLRMLSDSTHLYFSFEVADTNMVVLPSIANERGVEKEDRVELFFSKDKDMQEYYCFEIDPMGRVLSYRAQHYRKLDFSWDVPADFKVAAHINDGGYTVEGAIPLSFLNTLGTNGTCYLGAYRAEFFNHNQSVVEEWLTWKDPKTPQPDFHVPSSLGKLVWMTPNK
jgi:hypothetical protein